MSITRMLRSPVAVFLTLASCVAGAPVQIGGENIGLGQAVYSQPELAEALARTYQALEWQEQNRENQAAARNLDHIGGSNLLRNLDHIGGGNLLRNLDHIGGGNLLRNIETGEQSHSIENRRSINEQFNNEQTYEIGTGNSQLEQFTDNESSDSPIYENLRIPSLADGFEDDPSKWSKNRGTLDSIGGGNLLLSRVDPLVAKIELGRTLDRIGGANLLRDLKASRTDRSEKSTKERVQYSGPNFRSNFDDGFQDGPSGWVMQHRNLDHIGGGHLLRKVNDEEHELQRNLDHIGGGNLLRQVIDDEHELQRNLDHIGGGNLLRNVINEKHGLERNLDHIGGNLLRQVVDDEHGLQRNLDHIGGGNLLRNVINEEHGLERNLDHIGGGNLLRQIVDDQHGLQRNLDHIGGGNLLRNVVNEEHGLERNLDHIGDGNLLRNLDHIGGGNLLRQVVDDKHGLQRNLDHIGGGNLLRNVINEEHGLERNLDHIGGGNLLRQIVDDKEHGVQQNLKHIGGGNLLRYLDNASFDRSRSARNVPPTPPRSRNNRQTLDTIGGGHLMGR